ncbi:unnamed protein product [Rotaria sp. Silwood2]|nr:unnamed protein product [Rotaria sp. Silwood2]
MLPIRALDFRAMQKSIKELNEDGGLFIWSHFLMHILCNMKHGKRAKKDMLHFARQHYINNKRELAKINEFRKIYTIDKAIEWYTKDSFFYRLLNGALRSENFEVIYKFRSFIADLHQQLKTMHQTYVDQLFSSADKNVFEVYRGQLLPKSEFEKLKQNINGFVAMNTFLSTTTHKSIAPLFSGNGENRPELESVLFVIKIKQTYLTEPFADISVASNMTDENEVLFSIGSIFRIDSIHALSETQWHIDLSLVTHNDEDVVRFSQYLRESVDSKPTFIDLIDIFLNMNDYQSVVHHSETLLKKISLTRVERSQIYLALGQAELHINGDFNEAERCFLEIQKLAQLTSTTNYNMLASFYECMALLQIEKNNYTDAMKLLNEILQMSTTHSFGSHIVAKTHSNLGLVYRKTLQFDQAYESYEKSLDILTKSDILPKLHPTYSTLLNNLAYTKQLQHDYDQALKYYNLAREHQQKSLPAIHLLTATTLSNIGLLHMMKYDNEKALETYKKAAAMFNQIYDADHPRLGMIYSNMGDLFIQVGDYEQAKDNLNKALQN